MREDARESPVPRVLAAAAAAPEPPASPAVGAGAAARAARGVGSGSAGTNGGRGWRQRRGRVPRERREGRWSLGGQRRGRERRHEWRLRRCSSARPGAPARVGVAAAPAAAAGRSRARGGAGGSAGAAGGQSGSGASGASGGRGASGGERVARAARSTAASPRAPRRRTVSSRTLRAPRGARGREIGAVTSSVRLTATARPLTSWWRVHHLPFLRSGICERCFASATAWDRRQPRGLLVIARHAPCLAPARISVRWAFRTMHRSGSRHQCRGRKEEPMSRPIDRGASCLLRSFYAVAARSLAGPPDRAELEAVPAAARAVPVPEAAVPVAGVGVQPAAAEMAARPLAPAAPAQAGAASPAPAQAGAAPPVAAVAPPVAAVAPPVAAAARRRSLSTLPLAARRWRVSRERCAGRRARRAASSSMRTWTRPRRRLRSPPTRRGTRTCSTRPPSTRTPWLYRSRQRRLGDPRAPADACRGARASRWAPTAFRSRSSRAAAPHRGPRFGSQRLRAARRRRGPPRVESSTPEPGGDPGRFLHAALLATEPGSSLASDPGYGLRNGHWSLTWFGYSQQGRVAPGVALAADGTAHVAIWKYAIRRRSGRLGRPRAFPRARRQRGRRRGRRPRAPSSPSRARRAVRSLCRTFSSGRVRFDSELPSIELRPQLAVLDRYLEPPDHRHILGHQPRQLRRGHDAVPSMQHQHHRDGAARDDQLAAAATFGSSSRARTARAPGSRSAPPLPLPGFCSWQPMSTDGGTASNDPTTFEMGWRNADGSAGRTVLYTTTMTSDYWAPRFALDVQGKITSRSPKRPQPRPCGTCSSDPVRGRNPGMRRRGLATGLSLLVAAGRVRSSLLVDPTVVPLGSWAEVAAVRCAQIFGFRNATEQMHWGYADETQWQMIAATQQMNLNRIVSNGLVAGYRQGRAQLPRRSDRRRLHARKSRQTQPSGFGHGVPQSEARSGKQGAPCEDLDFICESSNCAPSSGTCAPPRPCWQVTCDPRLYCDVTLPGCTP